MLRNLLRSNPLRRFAPAPLMPKGSLGLCVILSCYKYAGKVQKNRRGFSGRFKGAPGGNRNPPGLVFFCQRFLLEKQKKMLNSSCKFLICVFTLSNVSSTTKYNEFAADFRKTSATRRADVGIGPYNGIWQCLRIRIGLSLFAAACRGRSGASRQLPWKGSFHIRRPRSFQARGR